jgi:hypothetical protein
VPSWLGLWLQCLTSSRGKKTNKPRARADRSTSSAMVHHVNLFHRPAFLLLSCVFFGTACFCPEVWLPPERLALFITGPSANEDLVCLLCFSLSFSFSHLHTHLFLFTYIFRCSHTSFFVTSSHPSLNHNSTNIFTYNTSFSLHTHLVTKVTSIVQPHFHKHLHIQLTHLCLCAYMFLSSFGTLACSLWDPFP